MLKSNYLYVLEYHFEKYRGKSKALEIETQRLNMNLGGFPGGSVVKNPPSNAGDTGSIPGLRASHVLRNNLCHNYWACELNCHNTELLNFWEFPYIWRVVILLLLWRFFVYLWPLTLWLHHDNVQAKWSVSVILVQDAGYANLTILPCLKSCLS